MRNQNNANLGAQVPDIGSLDKRITIQSLTTARSATGAEVPTWADWRTVWAAVEYPKTGSDETILTDQEQAIRRAKFTIRYTGHVQEKWRIVYESDTYDITVIVPTGRRKFEFIWAEVRK
jgi:SPP1 family predicted phage head-tail adaptor